MRIFNIGALFVTITVLAAGCRNNAEQTIVGKWAYANWMLGGEQVDIKNMGDPVIEFKDGGDYTLKAGFQENNEKWQLAGDTLTLLYKDGVSQKLLMEKHTADTLLLSGKTGELDSRLLLVKVK